MKNTMPVLQFKELQFPPNEHKTPINVGIKHVSILHVALNHRDDRF